MSTEAFTDLELSLVIVHEGKQQEEGDDILLLLLL